MTIHDTTTARRATLNAGHVDAPAREEIRRAVLDGVQRPRDREPENRCRPDVTFLDGDDGSEVKAPAGEGSCGLPPTSTRPCRELQGFVGSCSTGDLCRFSSGVQGGPCRFPTA